MTNSRIVEILRREINRVQQGSLRKGNVGPVKFDLDVDNKISDSVYEFLNEKTTKIANAEYILNQIREVNEKKKNLKDICISTNANVSVWFDNEAKTFKFELYVHSDGFVRKDIITTDEHVGIRIIPDYGVNKVIDVDVLEEPICSSKRVKIMQDYFREIEDGLVAKNAHLK